MFRKLANYSICDISDGLVKYGEKDGGFIPNLIQQSTTDTVIGKAYTVLYAPVSDPRPEIKEGYIDTVPKDSMLILGLPKEYQMINYPFVKINNALYGGLMSTRAQYLECQGSIILGRIRDPQEHKDLKYPVWSYGIGSTSPLILKVVGINVPLEVKIADVEGERIITINPQDIIMGDPSGIVKVNPDMVDKLLDYVPKRVDADGKVAQDIKNGRPAKEAQKYWRSRI